ncbi:MAG TPA: GNAT family N-acetyltransferase [Actinomycetaceae bacterium]|nr:GNAT family N-acetyltransferase [Actinomycetaceae bacterium]
MPLEVHITTASATDPYVAAMLREHAAEMHDIRAPASLHSEEPAELSAVGARMWAAWRDGAVVGIVALVVIERGHGELKSMRTIAAARRQGVGAALLSRLLEEAERSGLYRVSLKVGRDRFFEPALHLYERRGFEETSPFGPYREDEGSVYMTIEL